LNITVLSKAKIEKNDAVVVPWWTQHSLGHMMMVVCAGNFHC
jgi:hypothetical protein